jgi:alcohol dehydrogenase class IV
MFRTLASIFSIFFYEAYLKMSAFQEIYRSAFPDHPKAPYTHVSHGLPFQEACAKHVRTTFKSSKAYILASTSLLKQTKHVKNLETALASNYAGTWTGVRPHTPWDDLIPIINDMRSKNADCLITIGGGSLTDGAKVIIYALANGVSKLEDLEKMVEQTQNDHETGNQFRDRSGGNEPTVPIICIPTTLSAGEYSRFGGGTNPRTHQKSILTHPKMYPSLVILDPALCTTTPEWVWLSTGVRSIDHCVEGICSLQSIPDVDEAAEKSLGMLLRGLLRTKKDAEDLDARLQCQLAANHVLVMLLYAPEILLAGGSHGIGHQLGPLGVGHGQTSCVLLPAVLKYNNKVNEEKQGKVKNIIWGENEVVEVLERAGLDRESSDASEALRVVFSELGMPATLKEVGVGRNKFGVIARNSLKDPCCVANPVPLKEEAQVLEILEMVVG